MYNNKVQSIRNKLEQQIDNDKKSDKFVLKRSATSLGSIETNLVKLNISPSKKTITPPKFHRSKTSVDLFKNDIKNNNLKIINQSILSRQLSDPIKKGNIKRTPAFRCEKFIDCTDHNQVLSKLSSKSNFSNKVRMFEQCQSKRTIIPSLDKKPPSETPKFVVNVSHKISPSPTKFKSNEVLKEELDIISNRRDSRSSSSSPVPFKLIPEYAQVLKNRKKKLTTFPSDQVLDDNLTDTLKKALKSPLPDGPPPKKPPRTFAHSKVASPNLEVPHMFIDTGQDDNRIVVPEKKPQFKSKTDPRLMLDKLENALLQNKIKSPRSRRKIVEVDSVKKENMNTSINNNNINTTPPQRTAIFNDCFPICANNEYAKPLRSKSEFFVDQNILMQNSNRNHSEQHIYAEPFQFKTTDVPDSFKYRIKRSENTPTHVERTHHEKKLENIKSSPDLHYLSTPVSPTTFSTPSNNIKKIRDFGQSNNHTSFEKIIQKDLSTDKNLFDVNIGQQLPKSISPIFQNSSTDSDFESSASTPSCDEQQVKHFTNDPSSLPQICINNKLYYSLANKMSQNSNENILQNIINSHDDDSNESSSTTTTPPPTNNNIGRVRALVQKLENVDNKTSGIILTNDNNIKKKVVTPNTNFNKLNVEKKNLNESQTNLERKNQYFLEKLSQQLLSLDSENDSFEHKEIQQNNNLREKTREISKQLSFQHKMYVKRVSSKIKYAKVCSQSDCSPHLFDCCLLVGLNMSTKTSYIKSQYPENAKVPHGIESLCFPDASHWNWNLNSKEYGGTYTLIITNENGDRRFGFCRRVLPEGEVIYLPLVYCILSPFRAVGFFNKILKEIESRHGLPDYILDTFLRELYNTPFPKPGSTVRVKYLKSEVEIVVVDATGCQKSIPDSGNFSDVYTEDLIVDKSSDYDKKCTKRNIQRSHSSPLLNVDKKACEMKECELEFSRPLDTRVVEDGLAVLLDTLSVTIVLQIFSSLLLERKIILVCLTISKLSTCMEALQTMLYPFAWQHTFISVLPSNLVDILNAPTPFLIGALTSACENFIDIEDGIVVDLDKAQVLRSVGDENAILPSRIINFLKLALNSDDIKNATNLNTRNVLISEAFLGAFLNLCGNYKEFIFTNENNKPTFEKDCFIKSYNSKSIQLFLEWFTETSMFNAFIDSQLSINNNNNNVKNCESDDHFQQKIDAFMLKKNKKKTFGEKLKNWTHF